MKRLLTLGATLCIVTFAARLVRSQDVLPLTIDSGSAAVWQDLKKLGTIASAMHVTAHPDDEDGGMLAFETRDAGGRVSLLTLTRGEGGQNIMSADFFDALGVLRTRELLDADRYYGVEQMFSRAVDYGFSKTAAEARQKWGEDRVVGDAVRAIRTFRPLVVIARFQGTARDGHGNHQMSGIVAREAFAAAGDPNRYPEQLRDGLRPWRARKLYMDNVRESETWNVVIHEGLYDPVLANTFGNLGRLGWWNHKSQNGGGFYAKPGVHDSYYRRLAPAPDGTDHENSYFDGVDISLSGLSQFSTNPPSWLNPALAAIADQVVNATHAFRADAPEHCVDPLVKGLNEVRELRRRISGDSALADVDFELALKERQFQKAIVDALGVQVWPTVRPAEEATGFFAGWFWNDTFRIAVPGQKFGVEVGVTSRSQQTTQLHSVSLAATDGNWAITKESGDPAALAGQQVAIWRFGVTVPENVIFTRPYWRPRESVEESWYQLDRPQYLLRPLAPYPLEARVELDVLGTTVEVVRDVLTTQHETGQGQVLAPLLVEPAISIQMTPRAGVIPLAGGSVELSTLVHSNAKERAEGTVQLDLPSGWQSNPPRAAFSLAKDGDETTLNFRITASHVAAQKYNITAVANYAGREYREGYRLVGYPGIRKYPLFEPAVYRTSGVDLKVAPGIKLAYIMGTGDSVPQALENLGVRPHLLSSGEIESGDLNQYDEIMTGVRVYAARDEVRKYNSRLLDYVRNGGVLVLQYNTNEFDHDYGPYPYKMGSGQEVSEEDAPVEILDSNSPVFTFPNRITEADFQNWVEQRGSRFLDEWDPHYEPLLSSHDQNQAPQRGGFLIAHYAKGLYVLQSYALYRQLPQGVPGAFRLLANLASLPKAPR